MPEGCRPAEMLHVRLNREVSSVTVQTRYGSRETQPARGAWTRVTIGKPEYPVRWRFG